MKLASFDIGIKNMAYCIFSISPGLSEKWEVIDWNVIDLTLSYDGNSSTNNTIIEPASTICGCLLKNKKSSAEPKPCGKKAKYQKNAELFCESHAKKHEQYLLPTKEHTLAHLRKQKVEDIASQYRALSLYSGIGSIPNKPEMIEQIHAYYISRSFALIQSTKKKNANETNLISIGWAIRRAFETSPHLDGVTHVVIENQISPIATRMKTIQGMLAQYFIMKSPATYPVEIVFVSSSNKLRLGKPLSKKAGTGESKPEEGTTEGTKYKQNKKDGVGLCSRYIFANTVLSKWSGVMGVSKKDDLADCFLQGVWFMTNRNIITCAENLKINIV